MPLPGYRPQPRLAWDVNVFMAEQRMRAGTHTGISLITAVGVAVAVQISWTITHSIGWAIWHGLLSWIYVIYRAIVGM